MLKVLCFLFAVNCFVQMWFWTGMLLIYIILFEEFK